MLHSRNSLGLVLLCLALATHRHVVAAESPEMEAEAREIRECRRHLHLIYEAIQAYRRVHHDVPNQLAELTPRFISEARYLVCPAGRRLGLTSMDVTKWKGASQTSYGYEFGPEPVPGIISGGSTRSMRDWKRLQMGLVGSDVPMVRCHTHERAVLNLSFGGRIYESRNIDWEPLFDDKVDLSELTMARRFMAHAVVKKIVVPARDPGTSSDLIDLSGYYTGLLDEADPEDGSVRPLATLSTGVVKLEGTPFDVRGIVQLGAARPGLVPYPAVVSNIVIGLPAGKVKLLLGTRHAAALESPVADCVFHLGTGQQRRMRIEYGRHVLACLAKRDELTKPLGDGHLAWSSEIGVDQAARLFQCEWTNPSPEAAITGIDFFALPGDAGPFLVAVTVEPRP